MSFERILHSSVITNPFGGQGALCDSPGILDVALAIM